MNRTVKQHFKHIQKFLDIKTFLSLSYSERYFNDQQYHPLNGELSFRSYLGFIEPKVMCKEIISKLLNVISHDCTNIILNFSGFTSLTDADVKILFESLPQNFLLKVRGLIFDYCKNLSDVTLEIILAKKLENLEFLSLNFIRSDNLTGKIFKTNLCRKNWPKFAKCFLNFTNINVSCAEFLANYLKISNKNHDLEIFGTWASKSIFQKYGVEKRMKKFCESFNLNNLDLLKFNFERVIQKFEENLSILDSSSCFSHSLNQILLKNTKILAVNLPITCPTSEEGGIDVLTIPLAYAIDYCDVTIITYLRQQGAFLEVPDYLRKTPLVRACARDDVNKVRCLLSLGAKVEPIDLEGTSALNMAINNNNLQIVEILLMTKPELNSLPDSKFLAKYRSPLFIASENPKVSVSIIKALLENGANPNWSITGVAHQTPALMIYESYPPLLQLLLDCNSGMQKHKRYILVDLLSSSISHNNPDKVQVLLSYFPWLLKAYHPLWSYPLSQSARLGALNIMKLCISKGADVNAVYQLSGSSALHAAVEENHLDCVDYLISVNCQIDHVDSCGKTPLHLACEDNKFEIVDKLLASGCNVNANQNNLKITPLMLCIKHRYNKLAMLIIKKRGNNLRLELEDIKGRSSLAYSIYFNLIDVAESLIKLGSNLTHINLQGESPLTILKNKYNSTTISEKIKLRKVIKYIKSEEDLKWKNKIKNKFSVFWY